MLRSSSLILVLLVAPVCNAWGQQWASKMFKTSQHDFGSVAAGAKSEFAFEFQNIYEEDLHVASVRTSCGCTSPRVTKDYLKTWEKGQVIAKFNTQSFRGQRGATITVVFDRPFNAEVQLTVTGYIRGDITFEPGEVDFGEVDLSQSAERRVSVSYAGRSDWKILDVRSAGKNFEVELNEAARQGGRVSRRGPSPRRLRIAETVRAGLETPGSRRPARARPVILLRALLARECHRTRSDRRGLRRRARAGRSPLP